MARPPWLLGIVADDRPFLMAVERLHGRIDVQPSSRNRLSLACQPCPAFVHSEAVLAVYVVGTFLLVLVAFTAGLLCVLLKLKRTQHRSLKTRS